MERNAWRPGRSALLLEEPALAAILASASGVTDPCAQDHLLSIASRYADRSSSSALFIEKFALSPSVPSAVRLQALESLKGSRSESHRTAVARAVLDAEGDPGLRQAAVALLGTPPGSPPGTSTEREELPRALAAGVRDSSTRALAARLLVESVCRPENLRAASALLAPEVPSAVRVEVFKGMTSALYPDRDLSQEAQGMALRAFEHDPDDAVRTAAAAAFLRHLGTTILASDGSLDSASMASVQSMVASFTRRPPGPDTRRRILKALETQFEPRFPALPKTGEYQALRRALASEP